MLMNAPRFFCELPMLEGQTVALPQTVSHHIRVRRLKAGQQVVLFDGQGQQFESTLQFSPDGQALAEITSSNFADRELKGRIVLVQGIASQDRMDWVTEKAVELGVAELIPVAASRSVVKLAGERATKRTEHWRKLIISASEQCGRNQLMQVQPPCDLRQAIRACQNLPKLLCHFSDDHVALTDPELLSTIKTAGAVCIVVGPEGGWDANEVRCWLDAGAMITSLGPRVLRTETAGAAATAALTALLSW